MTRPKTVLLAIDTGQPDTSISDRTLAKYDYIITQFDRQSRMAAVKAINSKQKWFVYQNSLLMNNIGSSGVSKTEADANPTWFLRTLSTEPYESSVARDNPPHFWKMQETGGTTATDSGSSPANGTYNANQTVNQASLTGNAALKSVSFGNVGGFATTFALDGTSNYTFEGWAVRTATTDRDTLIGSNGSSKRIILALRSGTADIDFWTDSSGATQTWSGAAPTAGTAFHWALTWTASTKVAELFINGATKGVRTMAVGIDTATVGSLVIGAWNSTLTSYPMNGRISHVAAWTSVLSASRIAAHYANGPNTTTGGGAIIESTPFPNNWLADQSNAGYRTQWASNVTSLLASGGWDGVFADDVDVSTSGHSSAIVADPADSFSVLTDTGFQTSAGGFLDSIYTTIKAAGFQVFGNISNGADPTLFSTYVGKIDGSTREFAKKFGTGDSSGITPVQPAVANSRFITSDYDYDQSFLSATISAGKTIIPLTYSVLTDIKVQKYVWASLLLDWVDGNGSGFCFSLDQLLPDPYTDCWTKQIGTPKTTKFNVGGNVNLWRRDFTGGLVIVNSTASSQVFDISNYQAIQPLLKIDGTLAGTSITLPAAEAEVLTLGQLNLNVIHPGIQPRQR